jgi:hypothetical protein
VTRTEWSAEPVRNMDDDGCQSTEVTAAVCFGLFCVVDEPHCSPHEIHMVHILRTFEEAQIHFQDMIAKAYVRNGYLIQRCNGGVRS